MNVSTQHVTLAADTTFYAHLGLLPGATNAEIEEAQERSEEELQ